MASEDSKLQQLPHHSALSFEYTDQFTVPQQWHTVSASMLRAPLSQFGTGFKEGRLSGARAVEEDIRDDMSIEELKALEHKCMLIDKKNAENPEYRKFSALFPSLIHFTFLDQCLAWGTEWRSD